MSLVFSANGLELFKFIVVTCNGREGIPWMAGLGEVLRDLEPGEDLFATLPANKFKVYKRWPLLIAVEQAIKEAEGDDVEALIRLFAGKLHFDKTWSEGDMDALEFPEDLRPLLHTIHYVDLCNDGVYVSSHGGHLFSVWGLVPMGRPGGLAIAHLAGLTHVDSRYKPILEELHDELAMDERYCHTVSDLTVVDYTKTNLRKLTLEAAKELGLV